MDGAYKKEAVLYLKYIRKLRAHVEYEKFLARMLVDNETTKEFKRNTENHPDKMYSLLYNNPDSVALTKEGRNGT